MREREGDWRGKEGTRWSMVREEQNMTGTEREMTKRVRRRGQEASEPGVREKDRE